jgi:hypothetical protein
MLTRDILEYVKKELDQGGSEPEITLKLRENGWTSNQINKAFYAIKQGLELPQADKLELWQSFEDSIYRKYRHKKRVIIFSIWTVLAVLISFQNLSSTSELLYLLLSIAIFFVTSGFITRYATPYKSLLLEILDTIARLAFIVIVFLMAFTGFCLVMLSISTFR